MTDSNDLFDEPAAADSVFADKGGLNPLAESDEIIAQGDQERQLARILNGINEGYYRRRCRSTTPLGQARR